MEEDEREPKEPQTEIKEDSMTSTTTTTTTVMMMMLEMMCRHNPKRNESREKEDGDDKVHAESE